MGNLTIGLVNLPQVRPLLADHGMTVVSGDSFSEAVTAIRTHVRTVSMDVVLLVGDDSSTPAQAGAWLRGMAARVPAVVVNLQGANGLGEVVGLRAVLDTPATWGQLLEALTGSSEGAASATVEVTGAVTVEEPDAGATGAAVEPAGGDAEDPWAVDFDIDDLPSAQAVQSPTGDDLTDYATATAGQDEEEDPWSSEEVTGHAPEPVFVEEPAPAPVVEPPAAVGELGEDVEDALEEFDFDDEPGTTKAAPAPAQPDPPAAAPVIPGPIPAAIPDDKSAQLTAATELPAGYGSPIHTSPSQPQPAPAAAAVEPAAVGTVDDFEDILSQAADERHLRRTQTHPGDRPLGQVIICSARNGGVSKSTTSTVLAQYAGDHGPEGWRVALLDFNIGQGDVRGYLSLRRAPIPTVVDAARVDDISDILVSPTTLNEYRRGRPPLSFGLVAGTSSNITRAEADLVTPALLRDIVADLRTKANLVIIDTETIDEPDQTGYWDELFLPLIRDGAWLLMISTSSTESVNNARDWLEHQQRDGSLTRDRVMLLFNRVPEGSIDAINTIAGRMANLGHHIGTMAEDDEVDYTQKAGEVPSELDAYAPVAASVLRHVTRLESFDPDAYTQEPSGFFGRLLRRGGKK